MTIFLICTRDNLFDIFFALYFAAALPQTIKPGLSFKETFACAMAVPIFNFSNVTDIELALDNLRMTHVLNHKIGATICIEFVIPMSIVIDIEKGWD